ncbi:MAG: AraC family transcriptional regulator [Hyphomonas sp.]
MPGQDALSAVLRGIRLTGGVQFCFMPAGAWRTDDRISLGDLTGPLRGVVPFHIVAEGTCWVRCGHREETLGPGDVVMFPLGCGHQLGAGSGGLILNPLADLPSKPGPSVPVLTYGNGKDRIRMICGYLACDAMEFQPIRETMPDMVLVRTHDTGEPGWLAASVDQIAAEVEHPRAGGRTLLERLTEMLFVELLRREVASVPESSSGWIAGLSDPAVGRCLTAIHEDPLRDWTLDGLARTSGASRTVLAERFHRLLGMPPMKYVRTWRLHLASRRLIETRDTIAAISHEIGYSTEAAFTRAFKACFREAPAAWRAART